MKLNRLLNKQLLKFMPEGIPEVPHFKELIEAVSNSYNAYERDIELLNRAFRISEDEYSEITTELKEEIKVKKISIGRLKQSIFAVSDEKALPEENENADDLLNIVNYLDTQIEKRKQAEQVYTSLITNLQSGILLEDEKRHITLTNQLFCTMFSIPVPAEMLAGTDCSNAAEQSKHLFKNEEAFVERINTILEEKVIVTGDLLELKDGRVLLREYIPLYINNVYKGHLWKYDDISDKIASENKLRESESRFRLTLEKLGDNVWEHDFTTGKSYFSNTDFDLLGYRGAEDVNYAELWWNSIYPDDATLVVESDRNYKSGKADHHSLEYRIVHKDGHIKWILDKGVVTAKKIDGSPLKIIGTHTDITSLKEIQNALKQSELQFQSLSENIPGILFLYDFKTDGSHEFSYISPTLEKILGIQAAMFTNLNGVIHPEDVPMLDMQIEDAAKGNSTFSFEGRIVTPEKGILWISLVSSLSYCRTDGTKVYTGIITDITQRKMIEETLRIREEKYRNITANMRLGLLEVDNDEVITFANPSFCEMSGYSEPELLGKNASSLLSGNDELALIQRKNELRKNGHSDAYELTVKDKQGETKWWLISGAPHYNDKGELIGSIGIHLDITKQKKLEFELLEAKLQAEKSAQAKEQFLANMSHEIRTPMNAILGMGHQLQKTSLDGRQLKYLSAINNSAEHLLVIINDILDISKIEAGKLNLEQIGFDFTELVKSAVEVMRLKAEEKGLEIFTTIDKNISQVLIGDPFRIKQVILNHVSNSIKFTEKGSVVIDCKLVEKAGSVETIQLSITDTGIGMDEEFLGDLFTKFSQEDNSIARKYGGTGLGMSISKKLLELMNGKIEVSSKKNKGTCISFTLPLLKGNESSIITKGERSIDTSILKGSRILLVEDNEMNRLVASTVLEHYEVVLVEAENGLEAINILNKERFDLVLMDVQMPVMNGIEATMRIRKEISTTIPIIALTANAIKGESDKCIGAGMNAYVTKPFDEESLIRTIGTLLGKEIKMSVNDNGTNTVEEKLFDLEGLRKLSRGNEAFVIKMVNIFIRTAPESVTEMRSAFDCSEIEKIKSIAHRLKPSIDSLCISSMKAKIREIESFPDHATAAELKGLIDEADQIISSVVVEFRKQFAS